MSTTLKDEAAIVGIGQTAYTKNSGVSELALAVEAVSKAIDDAGLDPGQIDGYTSFTLDTNDEVDIARAVGSGDATFYSRIGYGGGAAIGVMHQAAMAVATIVVRRATRAAAARSRRSPARPPTRRPPSRPPMLPSRPPSRPPMLPSRR